MPAPSHRRHVCITGMGLLTSLGTGKADNWSALVTGMSGVRKIRRFETENLRTRIAATVDIADLDPLPFPVRTTRIAATALEEALDEARLPRRRSGAPLFLGVPPAEMSWSIRLGLALETRHGGTTNYDEMIAATAGGAKRERHRTFLPGGSAGMLAEAFALRHAPAVVNTACATGATVIQLAAEAIRRGETDRALAVGADASVVPDTIVRFSLLAALSMRNDPPEAAARPFSLDRDGFVIGEGAAALVLEDYDAARARGAEPLGFILGAGESADNFHLTRSSPDAGAVVAAIRSALADSGVDPSAIGYVNAHGTGTSENDRIEGLALEKVFGAGAIPPVSSNKSMIGHTMSAAGAIEAVFSLLTIRNGVLPPTINRHVPDPGLPFDVVPNVSRAANVRTVLSNSFGFGGQNVCLILGAEPANGP